MQESVIGTAGDVEPASPHECEPWAPPLLSKRRGRYNVVSPPHAPSSLPPVTLADVADLFAYTEWANERMLAAAGALGREAWAQDLGGSFPTLGATLAHIVAAEWVWVRRWTGTNPTARPSWVDDPALPALRAAVTAVEADRRAFVAGLTEADLPHPLTYTLLNGSVATQPLRDLLLHAATHSTYHRGQAASMLRRLGQAPPATDYLVFAATAHAPPAG